MNEEKKGIDQGIIAVYMILGGYGGLILALFLIDSLGKGSITLGIIATISIVIGFTMKMIEKRNDKLAQIANINEFQNEYDKYIETLGIIKSDMQVTLWETDKNDFVPQYLWIANGILNIFPMSKHFKEFYISSSYKPDVSELKLKSIPIDSILYFEEVGELRKYTTVSGGGSSLKGALLGYAIAEDVGAIIGSREPITTNVVSEDDRSIELIYKNQKGQIENLEFMHDAYSVFKELIPLKELRKIVSLNAVQSRKANANRVNQKSKAVKEKLKQLNELKADGLITEEDFSEQKKRILESL